VDRIERDDTPVMFLRAEDFPAGIRAAWQQLEERFDSLKGRKFFGAFDPGSREYRACVQIQPDDDPARLGLEEGVLPGGGYVRVRLRGEPPQIYDEIQPAFDELAKRPDRDDERPSIEHYRRRDQIDLLLPVV
jgi:hypothetical protein